MRNKYELNASVVDTAVKSGRNLQVIWFYGFMDPEEYGVAVGYDNEWEGQLAPSKDVVAVFRYIREAPTMWNGKPTVRSNLLVSDLMIAQVENVPEEYREGAWLVEFMETDVMVKGTKVRGRHTWMRAYPVSEVVGKQADAALFEMGKGRTKKHLTENYKKRKGKQ